MKQFIIYFCLGLFLLPAVNLLAQKKLSESDKLNFESAFFEALKQKAIGNYDKAVQSLEVCYTLDSTNVGVLFELSKNFFWQKKYFEASLNLNKALKLDSKNIWLLEHAKNVAVTQQNYKKAIEYQEKIVFINPLKKIGLLKLYLADNNKQKALHLLKIIEKEQGLNSQLKRVREQLIGNAKTNATEVKAPTLSNLASLKSTYQKSKDFKLLKQILSLEAAQKNFKTLSEDATKALEIFPSQAILYLYAAQANNALKNYKTALDYLENGIDFVIDKGTQKNYYLAYANSYIGLKNIPKANAYKKRASQL